MGKREIEIMSGETVFVDEKRNTLQGTKLVFWHKTRCVITDRRFIYFDCSKKGGLMFVAHMFGALGYLVRSLVKGEQVDIPLDGLKVSKGTFGGERINQTLLELTAQDGKAVKLQKFDKSLDWFKEILTQNGMSLAMSGEDEWIVSTR